MPELPKFHKPHKEPPVLMIELNREPKPQSAVVKEIIMLDRLRRFANSLLGAGVLGFIFFCVAALVTQFDNYLIVALGSYAGFVIGGIAGWAWE